MTTRITDQIVASILTGHLHGTDSEIKAMAQEIRDRRDAENMRTPPDFEMAVVVEVESDTGGKLWVNVDGQCRLRIGHINQLVLRLPMMKHDADSGMSTITYP